MKIDFVTPVHKTLVELDQVAVLRVMADHYGIAFFPDSQETVVSPLLVQARWEDWYIQAHWTPIFGVGVGAVVNSESEELEMMDRQVAKSSKFETAFEEALANPAWVANHAETARRAMLAQVHFAAWLMERAWERASEIPATRSSERWRATAIYRL